MGGEADIGSENCHQLPNDGRTGGARVAAPTRGLEFKGV